MKMKEVIRERRRLLGMTQEQMAGKLGVSAPAVHKWERGLSFPDVTLLPALARLLDIDMNELFSFGQEADPEELRVFLKLVMDRMKEGGYREGFALLKQKVRAYPRDANTLVRCAIAADSGMKLYGFPSGEEKEDIQSQIEEWFQEAAAFGNGQERETALYMLSLMYSSGGRLEEAEKTIAELPEVIYDKKVLRAIVEREKGNLEEAVRLMESRLYTSVTDVTASLTHLMGLFEKNGDYQMAAQAAASLRRVTEYFQLWDYNVALLDFQEAVRKKDREAALQGLRSMLQYAAAPYDPGKFPLFEKAGLGSVELGPILLPAFKVLLLGKVEGANGLDGEGFLKDDPELLELAKKVEEMIAASQEGE